MHAWSDKALKETVVTSGIDIFVREVTLKDTVVISGIDIFVREVT